MTDEDYMKQAGMQAKLAAELSEVPVEAVIVAGGRITSRAHNLCERLRDFTAAEMQALLSQRRYSTRKFLDQCTLCHAGTCPMCAGGSYWTRIGRVVYGAPTTSEGGLDFHGSRNEGRTRPRPSSSVGCWKQSVRNSFHRSSPTAGKKAGAA